MHILCFICRQQDVRATEIDKVDMYQSYRPGDIVRAVVVSLREKNLMQIISVFSFVSSSRSFVLQSFASMLLCFS